MKVCVLGLGYVGSMTAAGIAAIGHEVVGVDVNLERINAYRSGDVPIYEPGLSDLINTARTRGRLSFLHSSEVSEGLGDVVVIATGTPPDLKGGADLSQVMSAIKWIKERQKDECIIAMKSTVPPGTGVRLLDTVLQGTPFHYASNPEFLREGQALWDWFHPDRIVIGTRDRCVVETIKELYRGSESPCVTTDITTAEMIKYAANAFLATKISFINEIAMLCDRINASIDDVVKGISLDPRIGPSFLHAGVGYGGSCFPKDVGSLDHTALTNGHSSELLRAVIAVNNRQRLLPLQALRQQFGRLLGVPIGVLGIAFKPNTDDIREAPAIDLIHHLYQEGASVKAYDPQANVSASKVVLGSALLVDDVLHCASGSQALVLMTEWPEFMKVDWEEVARCMKPPRILFDGRNVLDQVKMQKLGFYYQGIGRGLKVKHS
jgi:UDPglucose 6-dehydrogenase